MRNLHTDNADRKISNSIPIAWLLSFYLLYLFVFVLWSTLEFCDKLNKIKLFRSHSLEWALCCLNNSKWELGLSFFHFEMEYKSCKRAETIFLLVSCWFFLLLAPTLWVFRWLTCGILVNVLFIHHPSAHTHVLRKV